MDGTVDDLERVFIGLNRENFIHEIFEKEFNSSIKDCANALIMAPNYLRDIIATPTRGAGNKTLSHIYRYCIRTHKKPERYIFYRK